MASHDHADLMVLMTQGFAALDAGHLDVATQRFEASLALAPDAPRAWYGLGKAYDLQGRADDAINAYQRAVALDPDFFQVYANLGLAKLQQGETAQAVRYLERAVVLEPKHPVLLANLSYALCQAGRVQAAERVAQEALEIDPACQPALVNLGMALNEAERFEEAIVVLKKAIDIDPSAASALHNLAAAYRSLGRFDAAIACYRSALASEPNNAATTRELGLTHKRIGELAEAERALSHCLRIDPHDPLARRHLAFVQLAQGNFREGWENYIGHSARRGSVRSLPRLPPSLSGTAITLHAEQGLGDELFFLRFVPELKQRGALLNYHGSERLSHLLRWEAWFERWMPTRPSDEREPAAGEFLIGDLPYLLGMTRVEATPEPVKIIENQNRIAEIGDWLRSRADGPFLGLTWESGTPGNRDFLHKQVPLLQLADAISEWPGSVVILQRHPRPETIDLLSQRLTQTLVDLADLNDDLEGMSAALSLIDDYVGVSNTNMHIRAGLGRNARVLIPMPGEWRWMADGSTSPWFPGFKVYRESRVGWDAALAELRRDLAHGASVAKPAVDL